MRRRDLLLAMGAAALTPLAVRARVAPVEHSLLTADPGFSPLDLWGWQTTPFYQRAGLVRPGFVMRRAIDESFRHGANLVEIYRGGFPIEDRQGWSRASTAALHRHLHDLDMVVHWFPHRLDGQGPAAAQAIGHWAPPEDPSNSFAGSIELVRALGGDHFDALTRPPEELLDGLGTEQWPTLPAALFNKAAWPYLPGAYFYTDNHMFSDTPPNEIDVSASNGFGSDDQTTGYYQLRAQLRKKHGLQFWASQAECRSRVPQNRFGGLGHPDWILKQVNDQFRARARAPGRGLSPSAIWWINEAEDVCPDQNRRYVYGVSQDPIRCAVSARFAALGGAEAVTSAGRRQPQRYPYHSRAAFLQNNYLRAVCFHDRDASRLRHDPERLAHYDDDSAAVTLLEPLLVTAGARVREVSFEHLEPAGYKAVLVERLDTDVAEEARTFTSASDTPYLRVSVRRTLHPPAPALTTLIGALPYDRLAVEPLAAGLPDRFLLSDSFGRHPELAVLVLSKGRLAGSRFMSNREAVIANPSAVPVVKLLRVSGAGEMPFQVHEFGRWVFRGAQPSLLHPGEDYLKCYLPAGGSARLQRYGWMDGVARPGWGCQHTVALSECSRTGGRASVMAQVRSVTSFLFAPRVRFKNPVASVRLDGRPWQYFDRKWVFLPNRPGRCRLEIIEGEPAGPHLARTFAHIESCAWRNGRLRFEARLPVWTDSVPEGFWFSALIRHPKRDLSGVTGGKLVRTRKEEASVVSFQPGTVELDFSDGGSLPRLDVDADISHHLAGQSALMLEPYLAGLPSEPLPLGEVNAASLSRLGVVVWNHYFLETLPKNFPAAALRDYVLRGGGLLLLTNALRALPMLLGKVLGTMRTLYINHRAFRQLADSGLTPAAPGHPVFEGLEVSAGGISLFPPQGFDIFQRADWMEPPSALARLWVRPNPGEQVSEEIFSSAPVLWEMPLGRGRILAYACGLRCGLGSPDRWVPAASAARFIHNALRRLGGGSASGRVGILR